MAHDQDAQHNAGSEWVTPHDDEAPPETDDQTTPVLAGDDWVGEPLAVSVGPNPVPWDAEHALLGSLLMRSEDVEEAAGELAAEHFGDPVHRMIWVVLMTMQKSGAPIDIVTMAETATRMGVSDAIGGLPGLMQLLDDAAQMVPVWHWRAFAGIVHEKAKLRQILRTVEQAAKAVQGGRHSANHIVAEAITGLEAAMGRIRVPYRHLRDLVEDSLHTLEETGKRGGGITGVTSGSTVLDEVTLGFQPQDLIILAARPSMGKTTLALNWARNAALEGEKTVGIFSLEMGAEALAQKFLSMESGVPLQELRAARINTNDWVKLAYGVNQLKQASVLIDDTAGLSVAEFRARAKEMKRRENIDLIIVDYLQLMEYRGQENRNQEISGISRTLKQVARELHVPVIALSQLSRKVEEREDKRPMMSDLRESGAIEQDADMIIFLYRDGYYRRHDGMAETEDVTDVIIAKQRNGPVGTVTLRFDKTIGRFVDHGDLVST